MPRVLTKDWALGLYGGTQRAFFKLSQVSFKFVSLTSGADKLETRTDKLGSYVIQNRI